MSSSSQKANPTRQPDQQSSEQSPRVPAPQNLVQSTFDALIDSDELLETVTFMQRAGWNREALDTALATHRLFRIDLGGVSAYPAFYLDTRYDRRELESVIELLGDLSGGSKWLFFTKPKASLSAPLAGSPTARARAGEAVPWPVPTEGVYIGPPGVPRTPLQALEAGELERVRRAAAAFAQG